MPKATAPDVEQRLKQVEAERDRLRQRLKEVEAERDEYRRAIYVWAASRVNPQELERQVMEPEGTPFTQLLEELEGNHHGYGCETGIVAKRM